MIYFNSKQKYNEDEILFNEEKSFTLNEDFTGLENIPKFSSTEKIYRSVICAEVVVSLMEIYIKMGYMPYLYTNYSGVISVIQERILYYKRCMIPFKVIFENI